MPHYLYYEVSVVVLGIDVILAIELKLSQFSLRYP
jgi:hypothetical protein